MVDSVEIIRFFTSFKNDNHQQFPYYDTVPWWEGTEGRGRFLSSPPPSPSPIEGEGSK
jgi:hypothetical protein